jgi:hypothetical protein
MPSTSGAARSSVFCHANPLANPPAKMVETSSGFRQRRHEAAEQQQADEDREQRDHQALEGR